MTTKDIITLLKSKGFEHNSWPSKPDWKGRRRTEHFFIKGDCRIRIRHSLVEVEFIQSKNLLKLEGNLLGPFRDGVMFDLDSREMVR